MEPFTDERMNKLFVGSLYGEQKLIENTHEEPSLTLTVIKIQIIQIMGLKNGCFGAQDIVVKITVHDIFHRSS